MVRVERPCWVKASLEHDLVNIQAAYAANIRLEKNGHISREDKK